MDLEYEDVEHDEDFAGADGELWAQHLAGEFASMDEQTAREVMRIRTGRKTGDLCWGSGAKAPQAFARDLSGPSQVPTPIDVAAVTGPLPPPP